MTRAETRGRKPIGQPEMVWGRVSVEVKQTINDLSDRLGLPKSRIVAALLAVGLANLDQAQFPRRTAQDQEELPLDRAS